MEQKYLETIRNGLQGLREGLARATDSLDDTVNVVLEGLDDINDYLKRMMETDSKSDGEDVSEPSEPVRETGGRDNHLQYLYDYINRYGNPMEKVLVRDQATQKYLDENRHLLEAMVGRIAKRYSTKSEGDTLT